MNKRQWVDVSNDEISEKAIRTLYSSVKDYRISPNSYNSGARFAGTFGFPATIYILAGRCKYKLGNDELILQEGEILEIEKGDYAFEVLGDATARLVKVFELPSLLPNKLP